MLSALNIKNFALVEKLDLEFEKGMISLTGETGAGKSIILGAIGLILGDKAKKNVVRNGTDKTIVSASFNISSLPKVKEFLLKYDYFENENECIIRRIVRKDGRSSCYINDSTASIAKIKELGEMLVEIHGQHQHQFLSKERKQIDLIDSYCGLTKERNKVGVLYREWKEKEKELIDIKNNFEENFKKFKLLSYQKSELENLDLSEGEFEELEIIFQRLSSAEDVLLNCDNTISLLSGTNEYDSGILDSLNTAIKYITEIKTKDKNETIELLESAKINIEEAIPSIEYLKDKFEINPEKLLEIKNRMSEINKISDSFHVLPENLFSLLQEVSKEIENLNYSDTVVKDKELEVEQIFNEYLKEAKSLSEKRTKNIKKMESKISEIASQLKLAENIFKVHFKTSYLSDEIKYTNTGIDSVDFYIRPNLGQDYESIKDIASGGELSRLSLSIQVVSLENENTPTMIFDEVDTGLSGETGNVVGELLKKVSKNGQVFCVTHLPQVASQGDHHFLVSKDDFERDNDIITLSMIKELNKEDRIKEVARMIGGDVNSNESFENAKLMLSMSK